MPKIKRIAAIIPAWNESGKIGLTVKKTVPFVDKVIVIDDGSFDATVQEAKKNGAFVISHKKNIGAGAAIRTGIGYALKNKYSACVVLGGDDQDNPQEIPKLLEKLEEGYDFVQGSRNLRHGSTENMPLFRSFTTTAYSLFFRLITGFPITDGSNGFRAFKTSIFKNKKINLGQKWLEKYELEPYLFFYAIKENFKVTEVPVVKRYPKNKKGFTKMVPLKDWWSITRPLIFLKLGLKK